MSFPTSTQKRFWMFENDEVVKSKRKEIHERFIREETAKGRTDVSFLSFEEAEMLLQFFTVKLLDFCAKFKPPMPKNTIGTAIQYFKRYYLKHSVMNFHPKEILVTAAYLACKTEEFNVSIEQFTANINGNKERATDIILTNELALVREMDFHLHIHSPFRPVEGFLIDIKTRSPSSGDPEKYRPHIEKFLDQCLLTNVCFLYAPSQIALAAVIDGALKNGSNLDTYVTQVLLAGEDPANLKNIIMAVKNIRIMAAKANDVEADNEKIRQIMAKLELCRNQENNPDSAQYVRAPVDDDD